LKNKKIYLFLTLFLVFAGLFYFLSQNAKQEPAYQQLVNHFTNVLHKKEKLLNQLMEKVISDLKSNNSDSLIHNSTYFEDVFKEHQLAIVVSKNDSVVYWSSHVVPVEDIIVDTLYISEIYKLSNGWYELREKRWKDYLIRGAILIKSEYKYQNDYLTNEYQTDFSMPQNCEMQLFEGEYNIFSSEGYLLCSFAFAKNKIIKENYKRILFISFILSYIFFISFLLLFVKKYVQNRNRWLFLCIFLILGIRYLLFQFNIPAIIYSVDAFTPTYYASSLFLPSLGDLLLHVISIFFISLILFKYGRTNKTKEERKVKAYSYFILIGLFIVLFFLFSGVFYIIKSLILNSSLTFDLSNLFRIDFYSIIGLITISFLLFSFFFMLFFVIEYAYILGFKENFKKQLICFSIAIMGFFLINYFVNWIDWVYLIFIVALFITIGFYFKKDKHKQTLQSAVVYIIIFSLFSTYIIFNYNQEKEKEKRKLLAVKLSIEQDPIAEYLYNDLERKIIEDTLIKKILRSENENKEALTINQLQKHYFNGYWSKYNLTAIVCRPGQMLNVKPDNYKTECDAFFQEMIDRNGVSTMNKNLYFIKNQLGRNSYLAKIPFYLDPDSSRSLKNLFIEMDSKFFDKEQGYPELLINKDIKINKEIYDYSYAKYSNNELMLQYGKYYYNLKASYNDLKEGEFIFKEVDAYSHLIYKVDKSETIILSKKRETVLSVIAPFSYIFLFYGIVIFVFLFFYHFPFRKKTIQLNFKSRIQLSMVLMLVFAFVVIGAVTLYYIRNLNNKKNLDNISEKAHSVLIEIEEKSGDISVLRSDMKEEISYILTKYSNVFFTDINIYTPGGILLSSSRPQVFDEGMLSRKMNANAFNELSINNKTVYIHEESIGKLNFISAYIPFRNNENELTGYINLPYFAKQSELRKEVAAFLVAFININVVLTALAVIIALLVSNYITLPMKLIQEKLSRLKLGKKNEKISWKKNDEIGGLIDDYNRVIDELAVSAEMLAKSERESAWREMAKQIAHEIKNPLTPMKLSVQHLKKAWDEKTPDWEKRFEKFSKTMIEQIESLSNIASEFSDFSKLPKTIDEPIDLIQIIENAVELYRENKQNIYFNKPELGKWEVLADKTQLIRIFNNLIKNSVQAISSLENGMIEIGIKKEESQYVIEIKDNGVGIANEQKEKIFSPNFTTKTGGMGLGLAMVRNIVENYKGKIWFESETGIGTTFFVKLPAID